MELSTEAGFIPGITVTDMYAETPGAGGGTKVMSELIDLADQHEIILFVWPEGERSRKFYEKFGFTMTDMQPQMIRVPNFDPSELEELQNLTEAIPIAPRNYKMFTEKRIGDINYVEEQLQEISDKVEQMKKGGEVFDDTMYDAGSAMRDVDDMIHSDDILGWGEKVYGSDELRAARAFHLDSMKTNLELTLLRTPEDDPNMQVLANGLNRYLESAKSMEKLDELDNLVAKKEEIRAAMEERRLFDSEYPTHAEIAESLLSIIDNLENIRPALKRIIASTEKYQVILDKRAAFFRGEAQHVPDTEDVEELYHASAYATELAKEGFSVGGRGERRGADAFGGIEQTVSFTHDLNIARDISRALKEITMIANGQLKANQILRWFQSEGIDMERVRSLVEGDLTNVVKLYKVYLALSGLREDPLFVNLESNISSFKGRDPRDVGVIKSKVNMRHPNMNYLSSMAEYQVPPEAILSVERVL
jgi:hypothetical protein